MLLTITIMYLLQYVIISIRFRNISYVHIIRMYLFCISVYPIGLHHLVNIEFGNRYICTNKLCLINS